VAKDEFKKEFALTGDVRRATLALYNINGSVTVQGYSGNTVVVEVTRTVKARSTELLERGRKEAQPGFEQHGDSVLVYVAGPKDSRPQRRQHQLHSENGRFSDNWLNNREPDYYYGFDFVVKVPARMDVRISAVNNGAVVVRDVTGTLQASNVNGSVSVVNAVDLLTAHSVNGKVEVSYAAPPTRDATYYTVNGNITVAYPPNTDADIYFKTTNGAVYSDFPKLNDMPARVTVNQQAEGNGTKYRVRRDTGVRLGKGGTNFRFNSVNGNITIKQLAR
jgi:hypothetical protein